MSQEDLEWITRAQNGDQEAFEMLVEKYQTPVYHLCFRMMGESGAAEDAAQETFLRSYQNLKRFDTDRSFITWILSIAAHYCIDQHRRQRAPLTSFDVLPEDMVSDGLPIPENVVADRQTKQNLRKLLEVLNSTDRAAVILRYWYNFSELEIAKALKISVSAVKSRLHRARLELAQAYTSQSLGEFSGRRGDGAYTV